MKRATAFILLLGLTACAGPGGTAPSGGLMYRVPDQPTLTYLTADTSRISIDAGAMGALTMEGTSEATVDMSFARGEGGLQVTATYQKLTARLAQPMGASQSATESDIQGSVVFTLDPRGEGAVVSMPEMRGAVEQLANPHTLVHEFFPRLPGQGVAPGAIWTDTIQYETSTDQGDISSMGVRTYTLQGDTVVDGVTLLRVTYAGVQEVSGTGMTEGMEIFQVASGDVSGTFLWDPAEGVLVASEAEADMTGTVEVPAAGVPPMPITVRGHSVVRLQR